MDKPDGQAPGGSWSQDGLWRRQTKNQTKPNMPPVPRANCNAHIIGNWTATLISVSLHQKDTQMC